MRVRGISRPSWRLKRVPDRGKCADFCVRGELEPGSAGNFPDSGKFPWLERNGRRPQAPCISRFDPLPGARSAPPEAPGRSPAVTPCAARRTRAGEISA